MVVLKLCLQPNVSVTTNHSRRFKCHDVTVTASHAEGLNHGEPVMSIDVFRTRYV
jgi:hypothetical protein